VTVWNALPGRVVEAGCLTSVKTFPDEHLAHYHIQGYGSKDKDKVKIKYIIWYK